MIGQPTKRRRSHYEHPAVRLVIAHEDGAMTMVLCDVRCAETTHYLLLTRMLIYIYL